MVIADLVRNKILDISVGEKDNLVNQQILNSIAEFPAKCASGILETRPSD